MFSSSVRRVALSTPPAPIATSLVNPSSRATASKVLSHRCHQRRLSSSKTTSKRKSRENVSIEDPAQLAESAKPSTSNENVEAVAEVQVASEVVARTKTESVKKEKAPARQSRQKSLPSVPSTQNIPPLQIAASAFFSLHRPMSMTVNFPRAVSDEAFASIFTLKPKANPSEVMSTLTSTLEDLDSATAGIKGLNLGNQQAWNPETDELRAAITADSYRNAESRDNSQAAFSLELPRHALSDRYRPFHPPPPPTPMGTSTAESMVAGSDAVEAQSHQRKYTAVLTIEESTDANGEVTYLAHSSPLVADNSVSPRTRFLERMRLRQDRYEEYMGHRVEDPGMLAISVKRQRKLKIKKHKYKKLLKKTRNLRRRLDKT